MDSSFIQIVIAVSILVPSLFAFLIGSFIVKALTLGKTRPKAKDVSTNQEGDSNKNVSFLILIPAHNEEKSILETVTSLQSLDYTSDSYAIMVIADNCTDGTAQVAESAGARVYCRTDDIRRSKGYALEDVTKHILTQEEFGQFDALVIIDADTIVSPSLLNHFKRAYLEGVDFAQGYYSVRNSSESWRTELMTYAFALFNGTYLIGLDSLSLGSHLKGNGMMFSRRGLNRVPWIAASLAEDLEYSWILRLSGENVRFIRDAVVYADMPADASSSRSQRARWEHGRSSLRSLYTSKVIGASQYPILKRLAWIIDLWMPPLSVLALVIGVTSSVAIFLRGGENWFHFFRFLGLLNLIIIFAYLISPFLFLQLPMRYLRTLIFAPYYAVWRLIISFGRRPAAWVRTARKTDRGAQ